MVFHSVTEAFVLIFPTLYAMTGGLIRRTRGGSHGPACQRGRVAEARTNKEAIVDFGQRIDGVHVGREEYCGLGLADGDHALWLKPAEDLGAGPAKGPSGLGVDVIGEDIAGMAETAISLRVGLLRRCRPGRNRRARIPDLCGWPPQSIRALFSGYGKLEHVDTRKEHYRHGHNPENR
jgi:hypothetical protein